MGIESSDLNRAAYRRITFVVLLVAALGRILAVLVYGNFDPHTAAIWEYGEQALVAHNYGVIGRIVSLPHSPDYVYPSAYMAPGHIWTWRGMLFLFGESSNALAGMLVINILGSLVLVLMVGRAAAVITGSAQASCIAMSIIAVYPSFVYSVATYHSLNIYLPLFVAAILAADRLDTKPGGARAIGFGILSGLAITWRSIYAPSLAALFVYAILRRQAWRYVAIAGLVCAAVLTPWSVRNYVTFERFIPFNQGLGYNLWKGHNPLAQGSGNAVEATEGARDGIHEEQRTLTLDQDYEYRSFELFKQAGLRFIRDNPLESFVILPLRKIFLYWVLEYLDPDITFDPLYLVPHVLITVLAVIGGVLLWRQRRSSLLHRVLLICMMQTLMVAVFHVHVRYRMDVEPFLCVFAAYALHRAWMYLWQRSTGVNGVQS